MCVDTSSSPRWQSVTPQINLSLSDVKRSETLPCEAQGRAKELMLLYDGHVLTFTDGSKTKEGVGCAFVSGGILGHSHCRPTRLHLHPN